VGKLFDIVDAKVAELQTSQAKLNSILSGIVGTTGLTLEEALTKISKGVEDRPKKSIMDHRAISGMDKQSGDKKQYGLWLEKFKNALDQVGPNFRPVLNTLEKSMDLLQPGKLEEWEINIKKKLGILGISEDNMDRLRKDVYVVLIDKVNGEMALDITNTDRDGLLAFLQMHRWHMETSNQGLSLKRSYVMNPPQAKSEALMYDGIRKNEKWMIWPK
jgi:hypothetical protein